MDILNFYNTGDRQSEISILLIIVVAILTFFVACIKNLKNMTEDTDEKSDNAVKQKKDIKTNNVSFENNEDWNCLNCGERNNDREMKCKRCGHFK